MMGDTVPTKQTPKADEGEIKGVEEDRLTALENVVAGLLSQIGKYHPEYTMAWFGGLEEARANEPSAPPVKHHKPDATKPADKLK